MTVEQLREKLNKEYGAKPWPNHLFVDAETYANVCQAVFDWMHQQEESEEVKKRLTLSLGINNGIMFKNVELILDNAAKSVETTYLNYNDLKVIYDLIRNQYVNYENIAAIEVIRKIRNCIGETE